MRKGILIGCLLLVGCGVDQNALHITKVYHKTVGEQRLLVVEGTTTKTKYRLTCDEDDHNVCFYPSAGQTYHLEKPLYGLVGLTEMAPYNQVFKIEQEEAK